MSRKSVECSCITALETRNWTTRAPRQGCPLLTVLSESGGVAGGVSWMMKSPLIAMANGRGPSAAAVAVGMARFEVSMLALVVFVLVRVARYVAVK